jgi:hypothetical protein
MEYDWTMFFDDFADEFHPSFKKQISQQLWAKGEQTGIKQFQKYNFQLMVGMKPIDLAVKDDKVLITVEIITPTSFAFPTKISWFLRENKDLIENIHKSEVSEDQVEINWENNFPLGSVLEHISPYRRTKSEKNGIGFDVDYYYNNLPDVEIEFYFKKEPTNVDLKELNVFLSDYKDKWNVVKKDKPIEYISVITNESDKYFLVMDIGVDNTIRLINDLLNKLGDKYNEFITKVNVR